jgi:hypothetical protein
MSGTAVLRANRITPIRTAGGDVRALNFIAVNIFAINNSIFPWSARCPRVNHID